MSVAPPQPNTLWMYVGPGPSNGHVHRILEVDSTSVTTWSISGNPADETTGGFSWTGSIRDFRRDFKPCL